MKTTFNILLTTSILILFTVSCRNKIKEKEKQINSYLGKSITIPNNTELHNLNTKYEKNILKKPFKIITYINGDCSDCINKLLLWNDFINLHQDLDNKFAVMFYINSKHYNRFEYFIESINFTYPVIYDKNNLYIKLNNLPSDTHFQTFLVNKNNIVLSVGNPVVSTEIKQIYEKILINDKY